MRTIIFLLLLFVSSATQAQQLSPNFYNQFKAILIANANEIKGDFKNKKSDSFGDTYYYKSKKNIDGFSIEYAEEDEGVNITALKADGNAAFFQQLKNELAKLKTDGYLIDQKESSMLRISKNGNPKAIIEFNEPQIIISFFKSKETGSNNSSANLSSNFLSQFKALLSANWDKMMDKQVENKNGITYFSIKSSESKKLDGFSLKLYSDDEDEMDEGIYAFTQNIPENVQLFDQIGKTLESLKNEGYTLEKSEVKGNSSKQLFLYRNSDKTYAWVYLFKDNTLSITIISTTNPAATTSIVKPISFYDEKLKKTGFKDQNGNIITPAKYDKVYANNFSEGMQEVRIGSGKNVKYGFVDSSGKEAIAAQYDDIYLFSEGLAPVKTKGKWGYIDKTGKAVIPFQYAEAFGFKEGLAQVKLKDVFGYIDKNGKIVIPYQFTQTFGFREGLAAVNIRGKWGFVDKNGTIVIPLQYDYESSFYDGKAKVNLGRKEFYIDKTGKEIGSNTTTNNTKTKTTLKYQNGDIYEGEVVNNIPNGKGKYTYANGSIYDGNWTNGKFDGKGKFTANNGAYYDGEWKNGLREGKGKTVDGNGKLLYEGIWINGKQQ